MLGLKGHVRPANRGLDGLRDTEAMQRAAESEHRQRRALWAALVLMAVLSTLLTSVSILVAPVPAGAELQLMFANPLQLAVMQAMILTMGAGLIHAVGTKFGGKGNFAGAVALIAWIEFILSLMQIVQLVALVVMPPLADVIGVMGLGVFLWLLSQFVTELHGFANVWKVFGAIIVTGLGVSFAVAMVLVSIFGVGV